MAVKPWQDEEKRRIKAFEKVKVECEIDQHTKLLIREGVPASMRAGIWLTASGGRGLIEEVGDLWACASDGVVVESELVYFGCECQFDVFPERVRERLGKFLGVVYKQNKDIRYAPMIPVVSAFLLMEMDEEHAYACVQAMTNRSRVDGWYFAVNASKYSVSVLSIVDVVSDKCRKVDQKATGLGISLVDLFRDTMLTFLVGKAVLEVGLTIFDGYLNEGKKVMLRVFLAILKVGKRELLAAHTSGEFLATFDKLLTGLGDVKALRKLLKTAYGLRLSRKGDLESAETRVAKLPRIASNAVFTRRLRVPAKPADSEEEKILTPKLLCALRKNLESAVRRQDPVLVYRMQVDGTMFETMVEKATEYCPYLLLIKTQTQVIGAYLSDPPMNRGRNGSYFGRASTFVFRTRPFVAYHHEPDNPVKKFISVVMDENEKSLAVGGPGRAIYIENQLTKVASWPCEAFQSPAFTDPKGEDIIDIELYKMGRGTRNANTIDLRALISL